MKKFLVILLSLSLLLPLPALAADQADLLQKMEALSKELDRLKQQMQEMQQKEAAKEERITVVEKKAEQAAGPSWLEIGGDYRFRLDSLKGKVHDYMRYDSTAALPFPGMLIHTASQPGYNAKNDSLMLNRFGLNLQAKATEDIQVKARLLMYKVFGHDTSGPVTSPFFGPDRSGVFDGNVSHVPQDNTLRVDQAYATWSNTGDAPVWFSVGRRPSTGGVPTNIRQNTEKIGTAGVPGLLIDYAFDGMTLGYAPDIDALPGAYAKICYGRGFDSGYRTPTSLKDTDMIGINIVPYDTDQFHAELQLNRAFNMMSNPGIPNVWGAVQANVGDIDQYGLLLMGKVDKVGPGDFNWFVSGALSKTHPSDDRYQLPFYSTNGGLTWNNAGYGLLYDDPAFGGEKKSRTGSAIYVGARYDIKSTGTKIGLEYNHGSKYWITFAPASDDLWTGKLGTRGDVYEVYLVQELNKKPIAKRGKAFFRLGYQYYKFNYTGSNGWLGDPKKISDLTSTPSTMADVLGTQMYPPLKNAHDIYLTFDVLF